MWFHRKPHPIAPQVVPMQQVQYYPDNVRFSKQDHWTYPWAPGVTQYGARVVNAWWGNQMPGMSNFIPGIGNPLWAHSRSLQQTKVTPLNRGISIGGLSQVQSNSLMNQAQSAWWQRTGQ